MKTGPLNLITDVPGLRVGNSQDDHIKTGVTVLTAAEPFSVGVNIMGGSPGTRETDLLAPDKVVADIDALVLSGGSAFGLDAASGVADELVQMGRGLAVGPVRVPIVPAAILFDLLNGGDKNWSENPYKPLGKAALCNAAERFDLGSIGAGTGATTAGLKGGLGSASLQLDDGIVVGALVAANPIGQVVAGQQGQFLAAAVEMDQEFGGEGVFPHGLDLDEMAVLKSQMLEEIYGQSPATQVRSNTTIAIVATNAPLDSGQLTRVATAAQDGMARAIMPSHTAGDGDLIFAVSTGKRSISSSFSTASEIGHASSLCLSRAIARAIYSASKAPNDVFPTWAEKFGN